MYLDYYKFKKSPFHITPDPEFLFLSASHKEASASLIYGIEERKGFIAITGEIGVGKTTILRAYLEGADPERLKVVYIFNAVVSFESLLKQIFNELGLSPEPGADVPELVNQLHRFLIEEYKNDRNVVLIIDEAQNMPVETLENLRMLSNLETSKDKLVQMVMVGQPEFERKLELSELRQLKQRIAIRCVIRPLDREESLAYIQHRLMRGSLFHNQVFTRGAIKRIVGEARGFPRLINILCDNGLITGFGYQSNPVTEKIMKEVISDLRGRKSRRIFRRVWPVAAVVWVAVIFAGFFFTKPLENRMDREASITAPDKKEAATAPVSAPAQDLPVVQVAPAGDTSANAQPQIAEVEVPEKIKPVPEIKETAETVKPSPASHFENMKPVPETRETALPENQASREEVPPKVADIKIQETPPAAEPAEKPRENEGGMTARTVVRGDSVSQILVEIYGYCDPDLIQLFKEANPQVKDPNKITVGTQLQLPRLSSEKSRPR
jgi:general secretion pathway protein A